MFPQVENIARKADAAWKNRDADAMAELYAASVVVTDPLQPEPLRGADAIRRDTAEFFRAFPDVTFEQLNALAANERGGVATRSSTGDAGRSRTGERPAERNVRNATSTASLPRFIIARHAAESFRRRARARARAGSTRTRRCG